MLLGGVIYLALWGFAQLGVPALFPVLMFIIVVATFAVPIGSGIWLGQRLVERGLRTRANLIGISLIAVDGSSLAWVAALNKEDYWETVEGGHILKPAATVLSLALLRFGMGLFLRHNRKGEIG